MNGNIVLDRPPVRVKICRHGPTMYLSNDMYIGRSLDLYGEYSQGEVDLFTQLIKPGMVVLDIGANIGSHSIYFGQAVGPNGLVFSFEPQRQIYNILCGNIALNGLSNVILQQAGLGRDRGMAQIPRLDYASDYNFGQVSLTAAGDGDAIQVFSLDSLELKWCHFIKIDVEGMERQVLEGAVKTLRQHSPLLYVENDRKAQSPALIQFLFDQGYRLYWHLVRLYNPLNYFGFPSNVFGTAGSTNMLCVPKSVAVSINGLPEIKSADDTSPWA